MKELSIEQKAKRYDETLKAAVVAHKDEDRHLKAALERIFPELKESEDEKIRKALIDYFDDANKADENPLQSYGIHTDNAIVWLEKQGEKNNTEQSEESENTRNEIINYFKCISREEPTRKDIHNKWITWLEEQGNKKPVIDGTFVNVDEVREDFMQEVYRILDADSTNDRANQIIYAFDNLPTIEFEKQCEQKLANKVEPKFHEGDTIVEKDIYECGKGTIKEIKDGQYIFTDGSSINIDEQEGWQLKTSTSIERKPTDWSDEDEKMLNQIVSIIEDADLVRPENISIYTNWLKSLKPNHWKPTEAQLASLRIACDRNDRVGFDLTQLLKELKKL